MVILNAWLYMYLFQSNEICCANLMPVVINQYWRPICDGKGFIEGINKFNFSKDLCWIGTKTAITMQTKNRLKPDLVKEWVSKREKKISTVSSSPSGNADGFCDIILPAPETDYLLSCAQIMIVFKAPCLSWSRTD